MAGSRRGHEIRDVDLRWIVTSGIVLAIVLVAAFVLMRWTFSRLEDREARRQSIPTTLVERRGRKLPPEPRLQTQPRLDLRAMHDEEDAILRSYGWVDRERGIVRMPIETAMEIIARRGLPEAPRAPGGGGATE